MKILHTADWHLGAALGTARRYEEFDKVLVFLLNVIREQQVECVIIAGDVFDTPQPSNRAVEQYYSFLTDCARSGVKHCIVLAGNHDSPSFLEAPGRLLQLLNVHVFARWQTPEEHLVPLDGAVVAAIPFLHDRDVRSGISGETYEDRLRAVQTGTAAIYQAAAEAAERLYPGVPLIGTGHFWAVDRKEYNALEQVGNLSALPLDLLPMDKFAYLALGHIHGSYAVDKYPNARYSGSILPMTFAEHEKQLVLLDTDNLDEPQFIDIPQFRKLVEISGDMDTIAAQIATLKQCGMDVLLKVEHTGAFLPHLQKELLELCKDSSIILNSCRNREPNPAILHRTNVTETLSTLTPEMVFMRLLKEQDLPEDEQKDLLDVFRIAVRDMENAQREEQAQ